MEDVRTGGACCTSRTPEVSDRDELSPCNSIVMF